MNVNRLNTKWIVNKYYIAPSVVESLYIIWGGGAFKFFKDGPRRWSKADHKYHNFSEQDAEVVFVFMM